MARAIEILDEISVKLTTIDTCISAIGNDIDTDLDKVALVLNQTKNDLEKLVDELGEIAKRGE